MGEDEISAHGKNARFARWDEIGLDRVKADLLSGGHQLIGGPPSVRNLAWEWVWAKEAEQAKISAAVHAKPAAELLALKPTLWGLGIDLKEAGRRAVTWWKGNGR
jgi:hypothetical protein